MRRRNKGHRVVHFPKRIDTMKKPPSTLNSTSSQDNDLRTGFVIEEIDEEIKAGSGDISQGDSTPSSSSAPNSSSTSRNKQQRNIFPIFRDWKKASKMETQTPPTIPSIFKTLPIIRDLLQTQSSTIQDETVQTCLPYLSNPLSCNSHGIPHLLRERHSQFLHKSLEPLPAGFIGADASRPWLLYWALSGLSTMGEDVSMYRERVVETVRSMQNPTGGFGGGFGQMSHLAPSYAVILSLGIVGCAGNAEDEVLRETMSVVDRRGMWEWLGRLKCTDGGFRVCEGGEEDVRGAYCATVIMTLLSLPLAIPPASCIRASPTSPVPSETLPPSIKLLTDLLPNYVSQCQTFEGGISAHPGIEAHGAYAFCALACLSILFPPTEIVTKKLLDLPKLINWLSARQYGPEGGFAGRTNKLVDGCYSHWVGGCWPIIEAALSSPIPPQNPQGKEKEMRPQKRGVLYSREGLIRYIMCCCQDTSKRGGLRDKPGKRSDTYHTCYVLAGLSSATWQNQYMNEALSPTSATNHPFTATNNNNLVAPYGWSGEPYNWEISTKDSKTTTEVPIDEIQIIDDEDRVEWVHPIFVVPKGVSERVRECFLRSRDEWGEES